MAFLKKREGKRPLGETKTVVVNIKKDVRDRMG
jgi:hypothetical protein